MKDRSLIRVGAGFGLAASAIAVVANLLHPRTPDPADTAWFSVVADSGVWNFVHLLIGVATLLVVGGLVALTRFVQDTPGSPWATFTLIVGVIGAAVALTHTAVDGFAFKHVAERWAATGSPAEGPVYELIQAVDAIGNGLFNMFNGTLLGVAPLLGGVATLRSARFAGWVGVLAIIGGTIDLALAIYGTVDGELTPFVTNAILTAGTLLVTIWAVVTNWTMFRAAGLGAEVVEPRTA